MSASSLAEPLPMAAAVESERGETVRWSLATRLAFRLAFSFLVLMFVPFPLDVIPFVAGAVQAGWDAAIVAVGQAVFGIAVDTNSNGSGDRTSNWIQLLIMSVAAVTATLVWSLADRKATGYPRLWRWFHVYCRFSLAFSMIAYGAYKVIPSQFVAPSLDRLLQPFGDASPMGLLWTFMGASAGYTMFSGWGEMIGGLLLTNRRTALLGALVSAGVMAHAVALNFFYDVPVKIYSSILLLTALVIAAPDAKRLLRFFVLDRPSESLFVRRPLRIGATVFVVLFVGYAVFTQVKTSWDQRQMLLAQRLSPSPLSGIWNVDELTIDGVAHPPLTTDLTRWRRLVVSGKEWGAIQNMDDSRTRYMLSINESGKFIDFKKRVDPKFQARLQYERPDPKTLRLSGTFEGKKIAATLRKGDERTFLLNSRGFHWINESPFNR
jgi:hypothetical protein